MAPGRRTGELVSGRSETSTRLFFGAWLTVCAILIGTTIQAQAQGTGTNTEFNVIERDDVPIELDRNATATKIPPQPNMNEVYWRDVMGRDFPPDTPAFIRDSLVQFVARTYDLTRDNFNGTTTQGFTGGGWIGYRSGLIGDIFGVQGIWYTSQPFYAPADEPGSKLLTPDQKQLNVLGQAFGRAILFNQEVRGGLMPVDTPLINPQDNRMVPNTFEATTLSSIPNKDRSYDYSLGYIWNIKQRDSNDFISMSDALAGADVTNFGAPFAMLKYRPFAGFSTIFMDYNVQDFVNTGFAQAEYAFQLPKNLPQWTIGANYIDQRSVGSDLLTGSSFQTYQASGKAQMQYVGWTIFAAGSLTGNGSNIFSPYGTKPNYTDMQQVSFDNAGEKAIGASAAYDLGYAFKQYGLSGLSTGAWYTHGWGAINPATNLAVPNRDELDLFVQYRPSDGPLKGLRVKVQYSDLWQNGQLQPEFRFIVDYTVLFRNP